MSTIVGLFAFVAGLFGFYRYGKAVEKKQALAETEKQKLENEVVKKEIHENIENTNLADLVAKNNSRLGKQ